LAAALTRANVQYEVLSEDNFTGGELKGTRAIVVESRSVLNPDEQTALENFQRKGGRVITADKTDWLEALQPAIDKPAVIVRGPTTLRVLVRDQGHKTIVHLLNLNVQRLSSFADQVAAATEVQLTCRVPFKRVRSVRALTADSDATAGRLPFTAQRDGRETVVKATLPRLEIATILVIER
jgi:hypothetical protein